MLPTAGQRGGSRRSAAYGTGFAVLALVLASCGTSAANSQTGSSGTTSAPTSSLATTTTVTSTPKGSPRFALGGIIGQGLAVTQTATYLAWNDAGWTYPQPSRFSILNPDTGAVSHTVKLGGVFRQAVEAGGSLWISESTSSTGLLERRNPTTLALISKKSIDVSPSGFAASIALAGGSLWVAGGATLSRLSLPDGNVTASFQLSSKGSSWLAHDASGTNLVLGYATAGGLGGIELRNGQTGAVISKGTEQLFGVAAPYVSDVTGSGFWISEPTGNMGYVERIQLPSMQAQSSTMVRGSNGIRAMVAYGTLWVTQEGGGTALNYCADPATGKVLSSLSGVVGSTGHIGGVDGTHFYVFGTSNDATGIAQYAIPAACQLHVTTSSPSS